LREGESPVLPNLRWREGEQPEVGTAGGGRGRPSSHGLRVTLSGEGAGLPFFEKRENERERK